MREPRFEQILGVRFFNGSGRDAAEYISRNGGYAVVPAAPALANIDRDQDYRRALVESDLAIADSGFMVFLWRILRRRKVVRTSGLQYLRILLDKRELREPGRLFLILPSEAARTKALRFLRRESYEIAAADTYIAPIYSCNVADNQLVSILKVSQPAHVIIGIEKLGLYLRENLAYRPAIHCVGAALGFLTGDQKPIPDWADRFYLGWLLRLVRQPSVFAKRFLRAFELPWLIWKYGENLPPMRGS
ncbi:MAG: glycosyltransferase [Verrucomicrobia bacterium]|nr:MAG: glycosyltransferase [Verrucomicrobiota bacterium]